MVMQTSKAKLYRGQEKKQAGFASIIIAIVLILVLSLITVGFAALMRKETRSALDKHLSTQAYYAAEAGVNDAKKAINLGYSKTKTDCGKETDTSDPTNIPLRDSKVGSDPNVGWTCLTIDPTPESLEYSAIDIDQSKVVEISGVNGTIIKSLVIGWQDSGGGQTFRTADGFTPISSWNSATSVLRVAITPLSSGGINRDTNPVNNLIANTYTAFLYPNKSSSDYPPTPYTESSYASNKGNSAGVIEEGNCKVGNQPLYCNVKIKALNSTNYLLDLRSLPYGKSRVSIKGYDFLGKVVLLKNAQTLIDSTGKAQDVLRRIQVRIPSLNNYYHSDFGLETMGNICKQLQLVPDPAGSTNSCSP